MRHDRGFFCYLQFQSQPANHALQFSNPGLLLATLLPSLEESGCLLQEFCFPSRDGLRLEVVLPASFCQAGGPTNQLQHHTGLEFRGKSAMNYDELPCSTLLLGIITSLSLVSKIWGALQVADPVLQGQRRCG